MEAIRAVARRNAWRELLVVEGGAWSAVRALSGCHERWRPGRADECQPRLPLAQPARQPAERPAEARDQLHRAEQRTRQTEGMEKANSRHGVPEGEDPAAAGSGGRQPEHGARAAQRSDRRTAQGLWSAWSGRGARLVSRHYIKACYATALRTKSMHVLFMLLYSYTFQLLRVKVCLLILKYVNTLILSSMSNNAPFIFNKLFLSLLCILDSA